MTRKRGVLLPDQGVTAARDTIAAVDVRRIYGGFFRSFLHFSQGDNKKHVQLRACVPLSKIFISGIFSRKQTERGFIFRYLFFF